MKAIKKIKFSGSGGAYRLPIGIYDFGGGRNQRLQGCGACGMVL